MCPVRDQVQTWKHSISERVSNPEQDSNKILARQPGLGQPISCTPVIRGKEFFKGHGAQDPRVLYLCLWRLNACRIHPYRHDLIGQQQWNTQLQFPCPGNQVIGITRGRQEPTGMENGSSISEAEMQIQAGQTVWLVSGAGTDSQNLEENLAPAQLMNSW